MSAPRYRISRRLGQGGMAEVFEAELAGELGFSRKVAIKRMLAEAATDPTIARRFLDEARIASRLHHANIVAVLDVGLLDGLPFQVLELVDGINAQQLMQRDGGKLPVEIALIVATDVAHALDHAHTARDDAGVPLGIVHRDVKPANVLVSWGGDVKLGDFGIALARDRSTQTDTGVVAGTMGFMAPEQRTRGTVDGRSDVFSLGLALHAMLAGYSPLRDITVELAVIAGDRMPLDPALPDDIARLIASAVEPERLARPTAAQLADALGAALAARVMRDRRSVLRDHLGAAAPPRRGALDQLLGIDVVLTATPKQHEPAQYELRPAALQDITPTVGKPKPEPTPDASLAPTTLVPRRRARRVAVAAGASLVVGLAGFGAWRLGHRAVIAIHPPVVMAQTQVPVDAAVDAAAIDAEVAVVAIDAAVAPDAGVRVARHVDAAVPIARVDAPPAAPSGTGFLQVVGEDMIGGRVLVDGTPRGYPPSKIEVPLGHHHIVVEKKDGTRATTQVDVTDLNTVANPLRPSF